MNEPDFSTAVVDTPEGKRVHLSVTLEGVRYSKLMTPDEAFAYGDDIMRKAAESGLDYIKVEYPSVEKVN